MNRNFTRFAFPKSAKDAQERWESRASYARMERSGDRFIETKDSFYMVGENGRPGS
jgi:hypothetical protein